MRELGARLEGSSKMDAVMKELEVGVRAVLSDFAVRTVVSGDVSIRAHFLDAFVRYFSRVVSSQEFTIEWVTAPGVWNNVRGMLRLWPRRVPVRTEVRIYHNCPHLSKSDEHYRWLMQ